MAIFGFENMYLTLKMAIFGPKIRIFYPQNDPKRPQTTQKCFFVAANRFLELFEQKNQPDSNFYNFGLNFSKYDQGLIDHVSTTCLGTHFLPIFFTVMMFFGGISIKYIR